MKIELRKISVNHRLSEETLAFAADVWIDGRKVGHASNHGTGGCTDVHVPREMFEAAKEASRAWIGEHGTDDDRELLTPGPSGYAPCPLEYLVDLLVEAHERKKEETKIAKIEAKHAAAFAASGRPYMLRVQTDTAYTWLSLPSNDAEVVERALAHVREKYGAHNIQHTVIPTSAKTRARAYVLCPRCGVRIDLHERKDFESYTGREYSNHIRAQHPDAIRPGTIGIPYAPVMLEG